MVSILFNLLEIKFLTGLIFFVDAKRALAV